MRTWQQFTPRFRLVFTAIIIIIILGRRMSCYFVVDGKPKPLRKSATTFTMHPQPG